MWGEMIGRPALGYRGFYPHIPAGEIRRLIGEQIRGDYFKFTIERNPWDGQVSLYHWHYRNRARQAELRSIHPLSVSPQDIAEFRHLRHQREYRRGLRLPL